jgi:tRNA G18 (ribose-2'-O)-methylase SpoU
MPRPVDEVWRRLGMTRFLIDDLDDPRIAMYRHLKATNETRHLGLFVVEGEKLLERLVESPFPVASALARARHADRIAARLPEGVPLYVVPDALIDEVVGYNFHQGALACGVRSPWPGIDEILRRAGERGTLLLCPRLDNPENLGALARIADVFGLDAILAGGRCPDPLSRRVLRVSMGTALRLPVLALDDLEAESDRLCRDWGLTLTAAVTHPDAEPFEAFAAGRPARVALVMGSESAGLDAGWVARCDRRITIPMRPGADSLNVAVAAGILLYELTKDGRG